MIDVISRCLAEHEPLDEAEGQHVAAMQALCEAGVSAIHRAHWAPGHFTASAFVLCPQRQRMLLIYHDKLERWLQPGGHIEPGDADVVAAARREVAEETALTDLEVVVPLFDLDVHTIPTRNEQPQHLHHDLRVLFVAGTERVAAGSDARLARWCALDGWQPDEPAMRRVLAKIRALS